MKSPATPLEIDRAIADLERKALRLTSEIETFPANARGPTIDSLKAELAKLNVLIQATKPKRSARPRRP